MSNFKDFLEEQLQNPEFKKEWDALQPERAIIQAMIDAREATGITKEQLAEKSELKRSYISSLENGTANPSLRTLQRLAAGMDMQLKIEFLPINKSKTEHAGL